MDSLPTTSHPNPSLVPSEQATLHPTNSIIFLFSIRRTNQETRAQVISPLFTDKYVRESALRPKLLHGFAFRTIRQADIGTTCC